MPQKDGGNILITTPFFLPTPDSVIDASSRTGISGAIDIQAPETDLVSEVAPIPISYLDAASLFATACAARTSSDGSFVVERNGAPRTSPDDMLPWSDE